MLKYQDIDIQTLDPIKDKELIKKIKKYHANRKYKANLSQEQKDIINQKNAKINRDRYNDPNTDYKTTKNAYNNAKNKERTKIIQLLQTNHPQLLQHTRNNALNILQQQDNTLTTQTTKDNTQPIKDTTLTTKDTTLTTKDTTLPNNSKNKLTDIITYNDNNTFNCSICNLTIFNKFYNRHIYSKKHINNVQK